MNKQDLETLQVRFRDTDFRCRLDGDVVIVDKPVSKDEYGAPLFKGDKYWWVRAEPFSTYNAFEVYHFHRCIIESDNCTFQTDTKVFASKESAERWIKENKPRKPLYVDPDNGDEFFEGDFAYWFLKASLGIKNKVPKDKDFFVKSEMCSKCYNTREKCEIALAEFIAGKHNKKLVDGGFYSITDAINSTYSEPIIQLGVERICDLVEIDKALLDEK